MGRVLLSAGTVLLVGAVMVMLYAIFGGFSDTGVTPPPGFIPGPGSSEVDNEVRLAGLIWSSLIIMLAVVGLALVFKRLNAAVRGIIGKIAKFMHTDIFLTELALTALVWVLIGLILLFVMPVAEILVGVFFVVNGLCFILAWVFYGRKKYKL